MLVWQLHSDEPNRFMSGLDSSRAQFTLHQLQGGLSVSLQSGGFFVAQLRVRKDLQRLAVAQQVQRKHLWHTGSIELLTFIPNRKPNEQFVFILESLVQQDTNSLLRDL